jgi:hypothetical protein
MSFTEEPTRVWEVGEPVPFEIPESGHEPTVPELEGAEGRTARSLWRWFEGRGLLLREAEHFEVV